MVMACTSENQHLMIEQTRKTMIELGMQFGFTSDQTVAASQLLDKLLNEEIATKSKN
jgi:hypothetical protein